MVLLLNLHQHTKFNVVKPGTCSNAFLQMAKCSIALYNIARKWQNSGERLGRHEQFVIYFLLCGMISRCNPCGEQNLSDATANGWTRALDQTDLCSQVDTAIWNHLP